MLQSRFLDIISYLRQQLDKIVVSNKLNTVSFPKRSVRVSDG